MDRTQTIAGQPVPHESAHLHVSGRALFVEMYTMEGNLLSNLERDPKKFETLFNARCQEIQQNLYTPFGQVNQIPVGQVVAISTVLIGG